MSFFFVMVKTIVRFLKNWTLPVSMGLGTLLYILFAFTPELEEASRFFEPIFDEILPLFMFLILFVTFCKVDFHQMRLEPWHFWISLFQIRKVGLSDHPASWLFSCFHSWFFPFVFVILK